ncbi:MAG: hypothetical protein ACE5IR_04595, partial [bacterium]
MYDLRYAIYDIRFLNKLGFSKRKLSIKIIEIVLSMYGAKRLSLFADSTAKRWLRWSSCDFKNWIHQSRQLA